MKIKNKKGLVVGKMMTSPIFKNEAANRVKEEIIFREITLFDQFSPDFKKLILEYSAPNAICGYYVCALSPLCAWELKYYMTVEEANVFIESLTKERILSEIEKPMKSIQNSRIEYINLHNEGFPTQSKKKEYLRDWVANYEISDYLRGLSISNVIFYRICAYNYPEDLNNLHHEELERVLEEKQFIGNLHFIDQTSTLTFLSINDWINQKENFFKILKTENKPFVIVTDFKGHFITLVFFELQIKKEIIDGEFSDIFDKTVLILSSTISTYIEYYNILESVLLMLNFKS